MLIKLDKCLSDRTNQLKVAKHFLILVTIFSAVIYIVGFHLKRRQWHQYYEQELEDQGFDERLVGKFSEVMFISLIVFTVVFTIVFVHLIVKELLTGVLVICILEFASLLYSAILVTQPIGLSSLEFLISTVEVMIGFWFCYLLNLKLKEKKKRLEESLCYEA